MGDYLIVGVHTDGKWGCAHLHPMSAWGCPRVRRPPPSPGILEGEGPPAWWWLKEDGGDHSGVEGASVWTRPLWSPPCLLSLA